MLFGRIVENLTRPLEASRSTEGASRTSDARSGTGTRAKTDAIVYEGSFEEVNRYFRSREWSDELPLIPPTMEKIEAFLQHTRRAPTERIAVLPQANLEAVPLNIAANAVMAGCRPDSMPLLIAAVEAIADNAYNLNNIGTTWGVLPFLLVNGPALERLGIETCGQLISKGENRAIGRARLMHGQPMHCGVTSRRSFARIAPNSDPGAP